MITYLYIINYGSIIKQYHQVHHYMTGASPPGSPVASIDGDTRTRSRTQTQSSIRNRRRRAQVVNPDNDEKN